MGIIGDIKTKEGWGMIYPILNSFRKLSGLIFSTVVTPLVGTESSCSTNGTGTSASFNGPREITTDGTNLYVADQSNHLIRQIE